MKITANSGFTSYPGSIGYRVDRSVPLVPVETIREFGLSESAFSASPTTHRAAFDSEKLATLGYGDLVALKTRCCNGVGLLPGFWQVAVEIARRDRDTA